MPKVNMSQEKESITKKHFWVKEGFGFPVYVAAIIYAINTFGGNPVGSIAFILGVWYVYSLVFWKFYKRLILDSKLDAHWSKLILSLIVVDVVFLSIHGVLLLN